MVDRYTPRFVSQFDGSGFASVNCTMAAGAMLLDKQTRGRIRASGAELRARQTDQSGGTDLRAVAAAFTTYRETLGRATLPTHIALRNALLAGRGAILQGYYGSLPAAYRLQANANINHALYIDHARQSAGAWWYWVMDPIGKSPYQGRYVPESAVRSFGWAVGRGFFGFVALSSKASAGNDAPDVTGSTSFQAQLAVWVQATGRNAATALTADDLRAYLAWYGRKQSPQATADEIAAFVTEAWGMVSGWVGKTPAFLSSKANDPKWPDNSDPITMLARALADLVPGLGDVARNSILLLAIAGLILVGIYKLVQA